MWAAFKSFAHRAPLLCGGASIGLRYGIGDSIGQGIEHVSSGKTMSEYKHNWTRTLAFSGFGAFYGSGPGYLVYNMVYPAVFGSGRPLFTALFDVVVNCPFIYFPCFYIAKEAIFSPAEKVLHDTKAVVKAAYDKWSGNFREDIVASTAVWLPLNYLNFRFVPLQLRLPFISVAGIVWVGVLSLMRGNEGASQKVARKDVISTAVPQPKLPLGQV